jgi:hypothetical protein
MAMTWGMERSHASGRGSGKQCLYDDGNDQHPQLEKTNLKVDCR